MKNKPFVSVIMPVYNAKKYVGEAIESILDQTYKNFECIIVDDASTDETPTILESYRKKDARITVVRNERNKGVTKSLNNALRFARGKYIARMDADDWSYPERLQLQVNLMERQSDVVVSGSFIEVCDSNLQIKYLRKYQLNDTNIRKHVFRYSPFAHPATIWRADVFKKEKYDERIATCQDYELYFRVGKYGKFMNIGRPLLKLRIHDSSVSVIRADLQLKATVLIRFYAVLMHGYQMSKLDKLYNFLQEIVVGLIPVKIRFLIFNFLRRFNFY